MDIAAMPSCCGIYILHRFTESCSAIQQKKFDETLLQCKRSVSCVIISLAENQNKNWSKFLIKRGFEVKNSFNNRNSGNTVYLYTKEF